MVHRKKINILAIDTSGPQLSCAIAKNDKVIAQHKSKQEKSHSDMLALAVEKLLKKARLKAKDIDLYAISIGPGSFTGLRIGVAFIKGMNLFAKKPVAAVPTLDAMVFGIDAKADYVCPVVDAKRQNVYTTIYKKGKRALRYSVIPIAEILERLKTAQSVVFAGDGIDVYRKEIIKSLGKKAIFAKKRFWYSGADIVAKIGYRMYNNNEAVVKDLSQLKPMYLYPKDIQCRKR